MTAKVDLHSVTTTAWNARLSPNEWASDVIEWNKVAMQSCRVLSSSICDLLLNQISIGPSPSPLLISYLQYGMITRLVHPLDFFTRLPSVVSPSRPVQLNSFLTLLIAPFIQHLRAFDETTGDELCEAGWRDELSHAYATIAQDLARAYVAMCTLLAEGVEYGIVKEPVKPVAKLDNPTSPLSALFSPPTSPPVGGTPPPSSNPKLEAKGMATTNVHLCADILTEVITTPRTKAFVLMSRYLYPEQWNGLVSTLKKCCVPSLERLSFAYQIKASLPWLSRSDPEGLGLPWMSLMLAVEFETKGKIMYSAEDSFVRFEMLRSIRGYSYVDFYCELWCAALRTLQRMEYLTMEWVQCKDFLLVKVPLLMCKWKQVLSQESNPITAPTASHPSSGPASPPASSSSFSSSFSSVSLTPIPSSPDAVVYNDVEMSIYYVSQFSQLVEKQSKDGQEFDPLDWISRSCIVRGLVSADNLKNLIPSITITLPPPSAPAISIEALLKGEVPNTEEDVTALKKLISPELKLADNTTQVMSSICTSLCKNTDIQELMLILYVMDKDSNLDLPLVLNLIAQLSREDVLTVVKAHGRVPQMMAYLVQYCDEWGYGPPEDYAQHYRFGTAFCLLLKVLEYHSLRSHTYNQIVLHFVLRSIAARKIGVFLTPTQSNALHPRFHAHPETAFPFWSWYRSDAGGACAYRKDAMQVIAHKLLEILRLTTTLPLPAVVEKLRSFLGTTPAWTLIQCMPYFCSTIYQACLVGLSLETLNSFLAPLAEEVPHCLSEIAFWFIDELARGVPVSHVRPEGPLPLLILLSILEIRLPAIVFDTMKNFLGPILDSLKQRYQEPIEAVMVKLSYQQPRYRAFNVESVNASKFMSEVFDRVLDVAYPSSDLLQASFNSLFLLCAKIGPAHFVDLVCKEFMNVMVTQTGKGHSTVHATRTAELCGVIIGGCGSAVGLRLLYTEKVPIFLHWIKNAFQSELLAYFCMISGIFCGVFHVSAFVTAVEDSFGLQTSFAMQHISQIISDLIDMQLRQVTPVFTFATTFLSLLLTLPRSKLSGLNRSLVHQIGTKLKQLGRSDLVVSLLDLSDSADRAFAAHLFTSPI